MNIIKKIIKSLNSTNFAAIICHYNPDGDTLCGAFALHKALKQLNISSDVLCENNIPDNYQFIIDLNLLHHFEKTKYDTIIFIDCASLTMSEKLLSSIEINDYTTINIDHHETNEEYAKINYIDAKSSSASELVLELIKEMPITIDKEISELIYTAIITDTGQFAYSYTSSRTHYNAAFLIYHGADFEKIHKKTFNTIPLKKALLQEKMLTNMELFLDEKVMCSRLDKADFIYSNAKAEDTEYLVSILLSIEGVKIAILLREEENKKTKASFRSTNDIDVSLIAKQFGGGGHKQASGALFDCDTKKAQDKLITAITQSGIIK